MTAAGPADRYNPIVDRLARAWARARHRHPTNAELWDDLARATEYAESGWAAHRKASATIATLRNHAEQLRLDHAEVQRQRNAIRGDFAAMEGRALAAEQALAEQPRDASLAVPTASENQTTGPVTFWVAPPDPLAKPSWRPTEETAELARFGTNVYAYKRTRDIRVSGAPNFDGPNSVNLLMHMANAVWWQLYTRNGELPPSSGEWTPPDSKIPPAPGASAR